MIGGPFGGEKIDLSEPFPYEWRIVIPPGPPSVEETDYEPLRCAIYRRFTDAELLTAVQAGAPGPFFVYDRTT